jgi:ribosomal subunit interface protein
VKIEMRTHGFPATPGLREHVARRLEFALDRFADRIARVRVALADVNGPRGGEDKSCRIEVRLRGGRAVRATAVHADAYAAIDGAAHRVAHGVSRAIERERTTMLELVWGSPGTPKRPLPA